MSIVDKGFRIVSSKLVSLSVNQIIILIFQTKIEQAEQRIKILKHDIQKIQKQQTADSDDDDDNLDDTEALQAELNELEAANAKRHDKLAEFEKNKKWNVDNLGTVVADKTEISKTAGKKNYTESGFVPPKEDDLVPTKKAVATKNKDAEDAADDGMITTKSSKTIINSSTGPVEKFNKADIGVMETYPQFCEKYADIVEDFMKIPDLNGSRDFLLQNAEILLQENASNYLLLASLEDEMNDRRDAMKRTARQSQIITNIAELAKTLDTHPGNVIMPFFKRMEERVHLEEFLTGVKAFQEKLIQRAVVKRQEIDAQREEEASNSLKDIPKEQRLGPGGLDPLEVIETLPEDMVKAFESRDVEQLKQALMKLGEEEAEYHMKRCVDSGLWNAGG
jgi:cell division cycle protein 37